VVKYELIYLRQAAFLIYDRFIAFKNVLLILQRFFNVL